MDWFEEVVVIAMPRLRAYARKLTYYRDDEAVDLVQDTVTRCLAKRHLFARGTNQMAWMMRILHNTHITGLRRRAIGQMVELDECDQLSNDDPSSSQLVRELRSGLAKLEPSVSKLIVMRSQGTSYAIMARIEGIPVGTVRSRLSRGRASLRVHCDRHTENGV